MAAHNKDSKQALHILRQAAIINGKDPGLLFPLHTILVTTTHDWHHHHHHHDNNNNKDIVVMEDAITEACEQHHQQQQQQQHGQQFRELFQPKWSRTTLFLFGTRACPNPIRRHSKTTDGMVASSCPQLHAASVLTLQGSARSRATRESSLQDPDYFGNSGLKTNSLITIDRT
jgi:hypothetical protein